MAGVTGQKTPFSLRAPVKEIVKKVDASLSGEMVASVKDASAAMLPCALIPRRNEKSVGGFRTFLDRNGRLRLFQWPN